MSQIAHFLLVLLSEITLFSLVLVIGTFVLVNLMQKVSLTILAAVLICEHLCCAYSDRMKMLLIQIKV